MNPKIISEEAINIVDLKKDLDKIKKRDEEVGFRTNKTIEYLQDFVKLKPTDAKKLYEEIEKLDIPRLKDVHINKVIDLMPSTVDELKIILQGYTLTVTKDSMQKIIDVVKKYIEK
jgi:DNA-directed RNA polymerase subunit F